MTEIYRNSQENGIEAEQSVLGGLFLDNGAFDDVADILQADDFHYPEHRYLYKVMGVINKRKTPLDIITVGDALRSLNTLEKVGGEVYLFELARNTPTAANIKAYAEIVKRKAMDRKLMTCAKEIIQSVEQQEENRLDIAQQKISKLSDIITSESITAEMVLPGVLEKIDERRQNNGILEGLPTGFAELDRITHGLQQGDLIILGARPSMGKTTLSMNIAEHVAFTQRKAALVFSMEMPKEQLVQRSLSSLSRVEMEKMKTGNLTEHDFNKMTEVVPAFHQAKLIIDDRSSMTIAQIRAKCRRVKRDSGLDLVVVDYLTLMDGQGENETLRIGNLSKGLKSIARDLNVPVVVLSQLNRNLEQRENKRPNMSDLRQSGNIEQDADLILFIYRDEVYNQQTQNPGTAEILIAKHRNGSTGKIVLGFKGEICKFTNYAGREYIEVPVAARKYNQGFDGD